MPHQSHRLIAARWNCWTATCCRSLCAGRSTSRGPSAGATTPRHRLHLAVVLHHHAIEENRDERITHERVSVVTRRHVGNVERLPLSRG